ncbi:lytic murein transglycosylase B [Methylocaldum szegediense]|uniref:Membrane-bound lytic murein transglycosylase B n=1 Tax=Methylocaldum szegediense TaxID=73780 RepID=A0ABM9I3K0_9GAMM|nr:lytic murein transglycosylase B [Methylocaldum szegediense]CAI8867044.1 Membrane-bound lytic murein transglycosylase B [Methylocaldum szegediense]
MRLINLILLIVSLYGFSSPGTASESLAQRPGVRTFIRDMSHKHHFNTSELTKLFQDVTIQDKILEAIAKPYEAKPWYAYRKLFLTETRIQNGVDFWNRNAGALATATRKYGVPPEVIVAIIGIETNYGQSPGKYRVIDALSTLAFAYPKRAAFFRRELEEFLLLCREEGINPANPTGSYAGAMGLPQFMPSSYRKYAADGDGDHRRDIWNNPADAIASVARYFAVHGWRAGEPVAFAATVNGTAHDGLTSSVKPTRTVREWLSLGVDTRGSIPSNAKAALVRLDEETGPAYWLGLQNFYVITRYNHSPLYAMAAYELSRELVSRHKAGSSS